MISDKYFYDSQYWKTFDQGNSLEWVLTNGLGGYAGGSLICAKNRTHQGYLVASLHPPVQRYVVFEQITEWLSIGKREIDLETSRHRVDGKTLRSEGQKYLKSVCYDGTICFEYEIAYENQQRFSYKKTLGLVRNDNTVAIDYCFDNQTVEETTIIFTPQFNFREHNELTDKNVLNFETILTGDTLSLVPTKSDNIRIDFSISEGSYYELRDKYDIDYELITEKELETEGLCTGFTPYEISVSVKPGEKKNVSIICSVTSSASLRSRELLEAATDKFVSSKTAEKLINQIKGYYSEIDKKAGYTDAFARRLVLDADHFLVYRQSTNMKTILAGLPWFTDWGRDTMIAFTGLTLCTRRYEEAAEILKTFAMYIHNGMVPNMFPDDGTEPIYNTVDASLWYFYAAYKYLEYIRKDSKLGQQAINAGEEFVRTEIYPALIQIMAAYEKGTDFSIYMLDNGLLHAGSNLDQITWMDVRVGDMVVTPRHGCPVEINALWYNALRIAQRMSEEYATMYPQDTSYSENGRHYRDLADRVHNIFSSAFWNEDNMCLYDVIDGTIKDSSIRPNQIYAVSLPFSLLDEDKEKKVVETVWKKLYVGCGLRSLSKDNKDYHGQYRGALAKRDLAYHQGTAWGFLLGAFITAYKKTNCDEKDINKRLIDMLKPVMLHQSEANCIGGICEIFEGDEPHTGRGCYTQAWSTGEVLRAYVEDVM